MEFSFYLAHASEDAAWARELYEALRPEASALDQVTIGPGRDWQVDLSVAQAASRATVVMVSRHASAAYYLREEIARAIALMRREDHRVIPVYLEGMPKEPRDVPYGLFSLQAIDGRALGPAGVADTLKRALSVSIPSTVTGPPPPPPSVSSRTLYQLSLQLTRVVLDWVVEQIDGPRDRFRDNHDHLALDLVLWATTTLDDDEILKLRTLLLEASGPSEPKLAGMPPAMNPDRSSDSRSQDLPWFIDLGGPPEVPERFEVLEWLGRGRRGDVLRVVDRHHCDRRAGILTVCGPLPNLDEAHHRFRAIVALGEREGLQRVHDVLVDRDRLLYVTMETRGRGLHQADPYAWEPFDVALPIALALTSLHRAGIYHGAINPDNLAVDGGHVTLGPPAVASPRAPEEDLYAFGHLLRRLATDRDHRVVQLARGLLEGTAGRDDVLFALLIEYGRRRRAFGYRPLALVDKGGMGRVDQVWDPNLGRVLAMKVLLDKEDPLRVARFDREAKVTAYLEHPGVVPVHGQGLTQDGSPFYTMKLVEGQTLEAALRDFYNPDTDSPHDLRALVEALAGAAEAVAFAHARGIIHRDLKPANIHLGEFGAVYVLDWGLAKIIGKPDLPFTTAAVAAGDRDHTQVGTSLGTPGFQPPEQLEGDPSRHGPWSDVYALGACLQCILTGEAPESPRSRSADPLDQLDLPPFLVELVQKCTHPDPDQRWPDAAAFLAELRRWLSGAERRARALAGLVGVEDILSRANDAREAARTLRTKARIRLNELPTLAPLEQKGEAWSWQDEADQLELTAEALDVEYIQRLQSALEIHAELAQARQLLAEFRRARFEDAERAGDSKGMARYAALLRESGHSSWLSQSGAVTLLTDPPGATVSLWRWETRNRLLTPAFECDLGETPLIEVSVPPGRWLLRLRRPDSKEAVAYPVMIERGGHWSGIAPGNSEPTPIWLPPPGALEAADCYVPAGWFLAGGDSAAIDPLDESWLWCDGFVIKSFPVTHREYIAFLNANRETLSRDVLANLQPRTLVQGEEALYRRSALGVYELDDSSEERRHLYRLDSPAVFVDWFSAKAYADWLTNVSGEEWGLPHDLEWEKAARGTDGRPLPWGHHLDPAFACMSGSHPGRPRAGLVTEFPHDQSVYGVRGMAGNVRDWCSSGYVPSTEGPAETRVPRPTRLGDDDLRMSRGGAWRSRWLRLAGRFADSPMFRSETFGFRLRRYIRADSNS